MCVSAFRADFTGTRICMHAPDPDAVGRPVHVMWYQNTTRNYHDGPNAMLLHMDALVPMGPANFIETTRTPHLLDDMVTAVMPVTRGGNIQTYSGGLTRSVQVFNVGIYTVVLANNAAAIPEALHMVPSDRRPALNRALFDFYGEHFPGYTVALCCFNSSAKSEPLMFWWEPRDYYMFRAPALDEHTGDVPVPGADVEVDHWILASSYLMRGGSTVVYQDAIPPEMRPYLPTRVVGRYFHGTMPNGDFGIPITPVIQGEMLRKLPRLMPPR